MRNKTVNQTQKVRFSRLGIDHVTEVLGLENLIGNVELDVDDDDFSKISQRPFVLVGRRLIEPFIFLIV